MVRIDGRRVSNVAQSATGVRAEVRSPSHRKGARVTSDGPRAAAGRDSQSARRPCSKAALSNGDGGWCAAGLLSQPDPVQCCLAHFAGLQCGAALRLRGPSRGVRRRRVENAVAGLTLGKDSYEPRLAWRGWYGRSRRQPSTPPGRSGRPCRGEMPCAVVVLPSLQLLVHRT